MLTGFDSRGLKSAPTLDIPYARKVLEHLEAHSDEHNQKVFAEKTPCGTRACIAGTAVLMDPDSKIYWGSGAMVSVMAHGRQTPVMARAAKLLRLEEYEARALFLELSNSMALQRLRDYIAVAEAVQV